MPRVPVPVPSVPVVHYKSGMKEPGFFEIPVERVAPDARQQNKIIWILMLGDASILGKPPPDIAPEEREQFLQRLAAGTIPAESIQQLVAGILSSAAKDKKEVFKWISENQKYRWLLDALLRMRAPIPDPDRLRITAEDLEEFLRRYPDPAVFAEKAASFLPELEPYFGRAFSINPAERAAIFAINVRALCVLIYGKQQVYWEQFELLEDEAAERYPAAAQPEEMPTASLVPEERGLGLETPLKPLDSPADLLRVEKLLARVEIHGSPIGGKNLMMITLAIEGLAPKYEAALGDVRMYFSPPYFVANKKYAAVVGYVEAPNPETREREFVARTFYISNSQDMWRYLPDRETDVLGEIHWFGKGHFGKSEESLNLPSVVQKLLAEVMRKEGKPKEIRDPELVFAGTAREVDPYSMYGGEPRTGDEQRSYVLRVEQRGRKLKGDFYPTDPESKLRTPPETMVFKDKNEEPDFSLPPVLTWETQGRLYGTVHHEVFPSKNNLYRFHFCRDDQGRTWIGGIEIVGGELLSNGVTPNWIDAGDLTTPAYEHLRIARWPTGNLHPTDPGYQDMFATYLIQIPVIRKYLKDVDRRMRKLKPHVKAEQVRIHHVDLSPQTPKISAEEKRIRDAEDIGTLFLVLSDIGEIVDPKTKTVFGAANLIPTINDVWHEDSRAAVGRVPEVAGLREKVLELMRNKK